MLRRPANLVAALLLAVALSDDSLPAGFWENSGGSIQDEDNPSLRLLLGGTPSVKKYGLISLMAASLR